MKWRNRVPMAILLACAALVSSVPAATIVTLWVFGDSTVKDYTGKQDACSTVLKIAGWGEYIMQYLKSTNLPQLGTVFVADSLVLDNRANGGRAARTFLTGTDQAVLKDAYAKMKAGDYMLIQFGHNDESVCADYPDRCTPIEDFKKYIRLYVDSVRSKKATPILVTPMVRNTWPEYNTHDNSDGSKTNQQVGNFSLAMQQVAKEKGVPSVDLTQRSIDFFNNAGDDATKYQYFRKVRTGTTLPTGCSSINDATHFQPNGAKAMAQLVFEGLKSLRRIQMTIRDTGKGTVVATSNGVKDKANKNFLSLTNDFKNGDGWYESDFNPTVKIEAKPKTGYVFTGWSGDATGTTNPMTLSMTKSYAITATFSSTNSVLLDHPDAPLSTTYDASRRILQVRTSLAGPIRVRIASLDGRVVRAADLDAPSATDAVEIPLGDLAGGAYAVRIALAGAEHTGRLFVR
jgi:uncharacterized repeat protein (TIGR02543 family)